MWPCWHSLSLCPLACKLLLARLSRHKLLHSPHAGPLCENTLPALRSLIRRDNAGELGGAIAYVEFDVHVGPLPS